MKKLTDMTNWLHKHGVSSVQKMRRLVAETGSSHNNKHYIIWLSSIFPSIFDQMRWFWAWFTAYQSFIALFSPKPILYINSWNFLWSQIEAMSFISERSTVAAVTRRISFTRRKWCVHAWNGSGLYLRDDDISMICFCGKFKKKRFFSLLHWNITLCAG